MKILCLLQARMSSSRFPGKIMKPILVKPMIQHILDSLSFSKMIDEIVVITSINSKDDILVEYLEKNNWKYFRGDENDVLKRYLDATIKFGGDYIVRVTADNPLLDPAIIDKVILTTTKNKADYGSNNLIKSYPYGYYVEVISRKTLEEIENKASSLMDREHVTLFIHKNKEKFKIINILAPAKLSHPDWRLTVDTSEDLELIKKIFENLYSENMPIKYKDVIAFLSKNSELLKINENVHQNQP